MLVSSNAEHDSHLNKLVFHKRWMGLQLIFSHHLNFTERFLHSVASQRTQTFDFLDFLLLNFYTLEAVLHDRLQHPSHSRRSLGISLKDTRELRPVTFEVHHSHCAPPFPPPLVWLQWQTGAANPCFSCYYSLSSYKHMTNHVFIWWSHVSPKTSTPTFCALWYMEQQSQPLFPSAGLTVWFNLITWTVKETGSGGQRAKQRRNSLLLWPLQNLLYLWRLCYLCRRTGCQ